MNGEFGQVTDPARRRIEGDPFARKMGIELVDMGVGRATLRMVLTPEMANFHGTGHGGAIFALADAAHAAASNSRGEEAVAIHLTIDYLRPARVGETLIACAREEDRGRTTALYHIKVMEEGSQRTVAVCVGRVKIRKSAMEA